MDKLKSDEKDYLLSQYVPATAEGETWRDVGMIAATSMGHAQQQAAVMMEIQGWSGRFRLTMHDDIHSIMTSKAVTLVQDNSPVTTPDPTERELELHKYRPSATGMEECVVCGKTKEMGVIDKLACPGPRGPGANKS